MRKIIIVTSIILLLSCYSTVELNEPLQVSLGYKADDILLIINIDDMGMIKSGSDAAEELLNDGYASTGSVMVPCPDFERFIKSRNPDTDLGLHLTMTNEWQFAYPWTGVLPQSSTPSLYNDKKLLFQNELEFAANAEINDVGKEAEAQIITAIDNGFYPTHIDYHMGAMLQRGSFFQIALILGKKYKIPLVLSKSWYSHSYSNSLKEAGYILIDTMSGFYNIPEEENDPNARLNTYLNYINSLQAGVHYLYTHISYDTEEARSAMFDLDVRLGDYAVLKNPLFLQSIKDQNIKIITFREIQKLQEKIWIQREKDEAENMKSSSRK